ncbi:RrF2 family transcriptional regulator [Waddlia chondrophila]|uniref:Putative HTH-type transcriptional repressor n=1 Tax=Waddlia chondrophila (strain ATCC VR-1470 / WSU 86-1044) TaxID=716544 RepID=D6YUN8_WADCW|nr:Rrf2 family transcriptional regulator [Waddlia chondrophila]ADI37849.1 putative HTH-type transcriptional repressor [Waddlia chondrophila WSU 86-1044]
MLSSTSEYALRIMVILAHQKENSFLKGKELAKETKVSEAYSAKILQLLNRAGLVQAQKGLGGGYLLSRSADEISLFDIINAVDPFTRFDECPLGIAEHKTLCPLHRKLDNVYADFQKIFKDCSLSTFSKNREQPVLCTHGKKKS